MALAWHRGWGVGEGGLTSTAVFLLQVPVFQLVPLPGAHSHICVALGGLEITELR